MKRYATFSNDCKGRSSSCELTYESDVDISKLPFLTTFLPIRIVCYGATEEECKQNMKDSIDCLINELKELKDCFEIKPIEEETK